MPPQMCEKAENLNATRDLRHRPSTSDRSKRRSALPYQRPMTGEFQAADEESEIRAGFRIPFRKALRGSGNHRYCLLASSTPSPFAIAHDDCPAILAKLFQAA